MKIVAVSVILTSFVILAGALLAEWFLNFIKNENKR